MKMSRALTLLAASLACSIDRADDKPGTPSEAELRATITKGLGYLAKGGDQWMEEKNCNSCHHMPQVLWNHREARARGFAIDEKKFDEWLTWSEGNAKNISAGREMTALMKLALPDKPMSELTKIINEGQKPDGSWAPAGQFKGQKRPLPETTASSTRVFLLGLAANNADKEACDAAMAKAAALLAKDDKATSIESLAWRVITARRLGKPDDVSSISAEIAKLQHADGGWGWQIKEAASDSIATGLALFALQPSTDPTVTAAITKAQRYLIATQKEDGGWPVDYAKLSSTDRSKPEKAKSLNDATMIYSYWGTAWSTLGLLQGVPLKTTAAP